jgi:hypothetical protein
MKETWTKFGVSMMGMLGKPNGDETMVWKWEFYWEATFVDGIRLRIS